MASQKYTYSIQADTDQGKLNSDLLTKEIRQSSITTALDYINTAGDVLDIWMKAPLSEDDLSVLGSVIAAHTGVDFDAPLNITSVNIHETPEYATDIINSYFKETFSITTTTSTGPYTKTISWPYPIAILGGRVKTKAAWEGDSFVVTVAPLTTVGQLVSSTAEGSNVITVDSACASDYIWKGDTITVTNGSSITENMGRLISKAGNVVTMEKSATQDLASGLSVKVTTTLVPSYEISGEEEIIIGRKTHRASYIPANLPLSIVYTNTSATAKSVRFNLEWYC